MNGAAVPEPLRRLTRPARAKLSRAIAGTMQRARAVRDKRRARQALDRALVRGLGKYNIKKPIGRCLMSYVSDFARYLQHHPDVGPGGWDPNHLAPKIERLSETFRSHTMWWGSAEMIRQFIQRGFVVDTIYDRLGHLVDDVSCYDVIVDEWDNLPRWSSWNPSARTLLFTTGCHWLYHNQAELTRLRWLFNRRGAECQAYRQAPPLLGAGCATYMSTMGNSAVTATFGTHRSKIRRLALNSGLLPKSPGAKDWREARRTFLYFNGHGWVHKGLDLVLEAFLREPTLRLVAYGHGCCRADVDVQRIYGKEVSNATNIELRGLINPRSREFEELARTCVGFVNLSASEAPSGAAVQCLQFGLLPVATPTVGPDLPDYWPPLEESADEQLIEDTRQRCRAIAEMPEKELEERRAYIWEFCRANHSREAFSRSFSALLDELLQVRGSA